MWIFLYFFWQIWKTQKINELFQIFCCFLVFLYCCNCSQLKLEFFRRTENLEIRNIILIICTRRRKKVTSNNNLHLAHINILHWNIHILFQLNFVIILFFEYSCFARVHRRRIARRKKYIYMKHKKKFNPILTVKRNFKVVHDGSF